MKLILILLLQQDFYYPGKPIWAENGDGLHSKARVAAVNGDKVEVEFFRHHVYETLDSLVDPGPVTGRRTFDRSQLDAWNSARYEVIVPWNGRPWPKAQVAKQLGPDSYEVQIFGADGRPAETITLSRADMLRYNVFTYPADGEVVGGIKMDYADADVQKVLQRLNAISDRYAPQIQGAADPVRKADLQKQLARELFVEYKRLGIEHDGNLVDSDRPTASERRAIASRDPNPRSLGSYVRSQVGVCTEQAYVFWGLMARSGATKLGIDWMPYATVHSEVRVRFGGDGSNWNQDLTASRGQPVPGRNFEALSTSGGKPWEVMFQGGKVGLGYSSGISVDRPFDAARGPVPPGATVAFDRARSVVKREAAGMGQFAAAYVLKEAMNGRIASEVATGEFWRDTGVFTGAAHLAKKLPVGRSILPLAAGMAAVQLLHGEASLKSVLIDTGAYLAAGLAVNLLADGLIYPVLFAAGPPGWIAAGVYTIAKLAVTLYLGDKLSGWLHGLFGGGGESAPPSREGVKQKVEQIDGGKP